MMDSPARVESAGGAPRPRAVRPAARTVTAGAATVAAAAALLGLASACRGTADPFGPDPAFSTYFALSMVDGAPPPAVARVPGMLVPLVISEARLVPLDVGRTTDRRLVDDRTGNGAIGGNARDTTVSTGRMADIRVFGSGATRQVDSAVVEVVRQGDRMFITRPHPNPGLALTDTCLYENGVLVRPIKFWRSATEPRATQVLTYSTVR